MSAVMKTHVALEQTKTYVASIRSEENKNMSPCDKRKEIIYLVE